MEKRDFRVWDKINKRFSHRPHYLAQDGLLYSDLDPHGVDMSGKRSINVMPNNFELAGFYSGTKDKNGLPICEGDIVVSKWGDKKPQEVKFGLCPDDLPSEEATKCEAVCFYIGDCPIGKDVNGDEGYLEIIGNIYENPELLK